MLRVIKTPWFGCLWVAAVAILASFLAVPSLQYDYRYEGVTEMPVEEALSLKVNHGAADVVISNLEGGSCLVAYAFYSGVPEEGSLGGQPCPVGYWGMRGLLVVLAVLVYGFIRVLVEFFG